MRRALLAALFAGIAVAQVAPPPPPPPPPPLAQPAKALEPGEAARIEGIVRDSKGEPVGRAQLRLLPLPNTDGSPMTSLPQMIAATGNDDGTFVLDGIAPGSNYRITVQRQGYANTVYGQRRSNTNGIPVKLVRGQVLKDLVIEMTEQAVVAGAITDMYGDPVANAQIMLMRRSYQKGVARLQSTNSGQSNDLGEFRIAGLAPGTYYLRATERVQPTASGADGTGMESNLATFYPNAEDERGARALTLRPGDEMLGLNIQLRHGRLFSIRGKVLGADGKPAAQVPILSVPEGSDLGNILSVIQTSRPDGSFLVSGLAPGRHIVQNLPISNAGEAVVVRQEVTIVDKDVTDLVVQAGSGITITGSVRLEGGDLKDWIDRSHPRVTSLTPSLLSATRTGPVEADGSFEVKGIVPGEPTINVTGLADNMYIKSMRLDGAVVTGTKFTISSSAKLELVLSPKAAGVVGTVAGVAGTLVTMWSAEGEPRTAVTDQNRSFEFQRLPPGVYYLAAWEDGDPGLLASRDFLGKFGEKAMKIELAEGGRQAIEAPVISAEAYTAAETELQ